MQQKSLKIWLSVIFGILGVGILFIACSDLSVAGAVVVTENTSAKGILKDRRGNPLENGRVELLPVDFRAGYAAVKHFATTNKNGEFVIPDVADGSYRITALEQFQTEGYTSELQLQKTIFGMTTDSIDIGTVRLDTTARLTGTVKFSNGLLPIGLKIFLLGTSFINAPKGIGTINFEKIPSGNYTLLIDASFLGYSIPVAASIHLQPGATKDTTIVISVPQKRVTTYTIEKNAQWCYQSVTISNAYSLKSNIYDTALMFFNYWHALDTTINKRLYHKIYERIYEELLFGPSITEEMQNESGNLQKILTGYYLISTENDTVDIIDLSAVNSSTAVLKSVVTPEPGLGEKDHRFPLVFPLVPNTPWYYRQDSVYGLVLPRMFIGNEQVTTPAGTFECARLEIDYLAAVWTDNYHVGPQGNVDFINEKGLIKRKFYVDPFPYVDDKGKKIGVLSYYDHEVHYLGADTLSVDSLRNRRP